MEHEEQSPHPTYLKGFNEGYTMTKYMPDLAKEIAAAMRDTERGNGFRDGSEQFSKDLPSQERKIENKEQLNEDIEPELD